jgi:hypothetical protein
MVQLLEPRQGRSIIAPRETPGAAARGAPARGGLCRLAISRDAAGRWTIERGLADSPVTFDDLAAALSHARRELDAAAAMIELRVDGLYACVHQPRGWPQRICGVRVRD